MGGSRERIDPPVGATCLSCDFVISIRSFDARRMSLFLRKEKAVMNTMRILNTAFTQA